MTVEQTYRDYQRSARKRRSWAADNPGNIAIRAELLDRILEFASPHLAGTGKILDIGCGGGWLLGELAGRGVEEGRLNGVDLLEVRVNAARLRLPGADIHLADARDLPHPDAEFELVTLLTCLSSLPDRDAVAGALADARRVLAPGGLLLVYEPRIPNPFNRATVHVSPRLLRSALGPETGSRRLTGFPPLARHLGPLTLRLYSALARVAPTHALRWWTPGSKQARAGKPKVRTVRGGV